MKKLKDLKVGDTVYKVIYTFNSSIPQKSLILMNININHDTRRKKKETY